MHLIGIFMAVFIALLILGVPIGFSILAGSLIGFLSGGLKMGIVAPGIFAGLDSFPLVAIPAFVLAGNLMSSGGISSAIVNFIKGFLGRVRGSLGAVTIAVCMFFGAICGSSVATVSAVGGIMAPEMIKDGYSKEYTTALLAAAGFLGTLIPPSVPGIMYSALAGQKVTQVWMATLVPGVILGLIYMIANYLMVGRHMEKSKEKVSGVDFFSNIGRQTPKAVVAFIMPMIIFGGVYGGMFTATEAGIIAVVYGLIAGWIIYPRIFKMRPDERLYSILKKSAISTVTIGIMIGMSNVVGRMIALGNVSASIIDVMTSLTENKYVFLFVLNIFLLIVGMFMEINAALVLFCPLLVPLSQAYGIDPIHFGSIVLLNLEIGLMTPPFAGNLFVACQVTKTEIGPVVKRQLPFYVCAVVIMLIVTYVPIVSTWLPGITG